MSEGLEPENEISVSFDNRSGRDVEVASKLVRIFLVDRDLGCQA
jgi:hypothetical protein